MTDSTDGAVNPMTALFRHEVQRNTVILTEGLSVLAVDPSHDILLEPLERAAQQIKAAARIIDLRPAGDLAGAVEDVFSAVRRKAITLSGNRVSDLLTAVDVFRSLSDHAMDPTQPKPDAGFLNSLIIELKTWATSKPDPVAEPIVPHAVAPVVPPRVAPVVPPLVASVATPTVIAPKSMDPHAATLLELFREEVRSLTGVLTDGLLQLEEDATDPRRIEPLMRAAHSIKGAARIVNCGPAVDLAHIMEEFLVTAQKGKLLITSAEIDPLLQGVDLLAQMADADLPTWAVENAQKVKDCVVILDARLQGKPLPGVVPPPVVSHKPVEKTPTPPVSPPLPTTATVAPPSAPVKVDTPDMEGKDRVVRISAQSLTRLLSLAGESLVEARWLQPFARSLLRLRKHQDHLADVLEDLHRALRSTDVHDRISLVTEDARNRIADCRQVLAERIDEFEKHARQSDDLNSRLYREVIASRMRPFADGTHGLARMVRDVSKQLNKKIRFEVSGHDTDVDRDILDKLEAPLGHMLRNSLDHGMESTEDRIKAGKSETGTLKIEARHHAGMLNISVTDDGRGIDLSKLRRKVVERKLTSQDLASRLSDPELLDFLFLPGFSTSDTVTDISGRGVGMDAVQAMAQAVGGSVRVHTKFGHGTTIELQLPITLSVVRAVLVRIAGDPYALPLNRTDRLLRLAPSAVRSLEGKPHFEADGRHVGLVPAHLIFELPAGETTTDELAVVLIGDRSHQYGLIVEAFLGEQDLVVRPLDPRIGKVPNVAASALLDDGSPVLIVDVEDVTRSAASLVQDGKLRHQRTNKSAARRRKRILVVDDSAIVREAERQMLQGRGYDVDLAVDGIDGWNTIRTGQYDLVVSDIDMPRMTGLEFVKAIRADPKVKSIPVVIVSYKDRDEDRGRGLDVGANYYLTKSSFHDGQFLKAVEDLIGGPES